jgi:hypothetical protein
LAGIQVQRTYLELHRTSVGRDIRSERRNLKRAEFDVFENSVFEKCVLNTLINRGGILRMQKFYSSGRGSFEKMKIYTLYMDPIFSNFSKIQSENHHS